MGDSGASESLLGFSRNGGSVIVSCVGDDVDDDSGSMAVQINVDAVTT
jgi:hypothetical protein